MALADVKQRVNNWLAPRWDWLVAQQDAYYAANGIYFQGLWTHSLEVEQTDLLDGDQLANELDAAPAHKSDTWQDFIGNALDSVAFPARLRIDEYKTPAGARGWIAVLEVLYQGTVYTRARGVGPEPESRDTGWYAEDDGHPSGP